MPKTDKKAAANDDSESKKKAKETKPASPKAKKSSASQKAPPKPTSQPLSSSLELILPPTLGNATGDCNILVQIDPEDSAALDFEGTTGAIGRFQVDQQGIVLDLKGSQYQGTILPGPTAMIASLYYSADHTQELKLETITDEFCPLLKTQDIMAKLDGTVEGTLDESYRLQEEDVNIAAKKQEQQEEQAKKQQAKAAAAKGGKATNGTKRKASSGTSSKPKATSNNKKMKVTMGKTVGIYVA